MGALTGARRGLNCAIVQVVALGTTAACTGDDDGHPQGTAATALATAWDALPASLRDAAPAGAVLAVFEGTGPGGGSVRGVVARDGETCTAATADGEGTGASVLVSAAGPQDEDDQADGATTDLLASTLHASGEVSAFAPDDSTTSTTLRCGPEGAQVVLDPMPADLEVIGSGTVVRYTNGFPVGLVVGPADLRERATAVAAEADAPDPAVLELPHLALDDTAVGTLPTPLRRSVVATFTVGSPTGTLTGAVVLTGTRCALTVVDGAGSFGLDGTPDLALDPDEQATTLLDGPSARALAGGGIDGDIALTCATSATAVLLTGVEPAATSADGSATVTAGEDGGTLVLVGTAAARRSVTSLLARR
ncbi:hypothetical protein [Cellulomonas soli]|uniref:Uncharacterized protein n=1 Tax=Cellulomonas soli TaxID=931535 RepID=A0A512PB61_9CELL|nr:hypothetical protein [Cellulomonas soli]NYI57273.1 hypothetical protein [Cellulomonas soli]GEP68447.1 hypothetical protein CSO01_11620 [Cellulomonas soli]